MFSKWLATINNHLPLPPNQALKEGREPDHSDYKEFKLTCENMGFKMMLKLGWKEGEGLGSQQQGITKPVNK